MEPRLYVGCQATLTVRQRQPSMLAHASWLGICAVSNTWSEGRRLPI